MSLFIHTHAVVFQKLVEGERSVDRVTGLRRAALVCCLFSHCYVGVGG